MIQASYSDKLDLILSSDPQPLTIDHVEELMTNSIQEASKETIPQREKGEAAKPWTNREYEDLLSQQHHEQDPVKKRAMSKEVRKHCTKLKNELFEAKANQINMAGEQCKAEKEFRLMKKYTSLSKEARLLEAHFSSHFADRPYIPQPELEHPEDFPHLLPPDDLPMIKSTPRRRLKIPLEG